MIPRLKLYQLMVVFLFILLLSLALHSPTRAASNPNEQIINIVSDTSWKWNRDELSDWTTTAFNDNSWGFVIAPSEGTCGSGGNPDPHIADPMWAPSPVPHETVYFRKQFTLDNAPKSALMQSVFDDDGEIYVNGTLIRSDQSGTVEATAFADNITSLLKSGNNVIALKVIDSYGGCQSAQVAVNITIDTGTVLPVSPFKQNDPRWKDDQYAFETGRCATIEKCGCALSSIAMVLNYHGATKDPSGNPTTPETVNDYFKKDPKCLNGDCTSLGYWFGQVRWDAVNQYSKEAFDKFHTQKIVWNGKTDYSPTIVTNDINQNNPAILKVLQDSHWAVATGVSGDTFSLNDPFHNHNKLSESPYNNNAYAVQHYQKTNSDFSSFEAVAKSPAKLLITDPDGKQTGFDPQTNTVKQDIPNSYYFFDSAIADDTDTSPPPGPNEGVNTAIVTIPKAGKYKVKVISDPNKLYSFAVYGSDHDAGVNYDLFEATPSSQIAPEYEYSYSPEPGSTPLIQNVNINIRPLRDKNIVFCSRKFEIIPVVLYASNTFNIDNVDLDSVRFEGASIMSLGAHKFIIDKLDINRDGKKDLLMSFSLSDTKITCLSTIGTLTGKTKTGLDFKGSDSIKAVK